MICRKGIVKGRVQGVFFRKFTQEQAYRHYVTGYAKNLPDGSVEVLLCGDPQNISQVEKALLIGPPSANVDTVDMLDVDCKKQAGFSIL